MFIRPLSRFVTHIPHASTTCLMAISKYRSLHVASFLARAKAHHNTTSEGTKKLVIDPERGHSILLTCSDSVFLSPEQAEVVLENLDKAVNHEVFKSAKKGKICVPNYEVLTDNELDLRIYKTKKMLIGITTKVCSSTQCGPQFPLEAIPFVSENLATSLDMYERLKAEGKLRA